MGAARAEPAQPGTFYAAAFQNPFGGSEQSFPVERVRCFACCKIKSTSRTFPIAFFGAFTSFLFVFAL